MPHQWLGRHARLALASDACLVSSAAFGAVMALLGLALGSGEPPLPIAIGVAVCTLGALILGPSLAWALRGRRFTWRAVLGGLGGLLVTVLATQGLATLAWALDQVLSLFTPAVFAGPIALLALGSIGYLLVSTPAVIALFDPPHLPGLEVLERRIRLMRAIALVVLAIFAAGASAFVAIGTNPERAEIFIFAILAGLNAALMAAGADLVQGWHRSRP